MFSLDWTVSSWHKQVKLFCGFRARGEEDEFKLRLEVIALAEWDRQSDNHCLPVCPRLIILFLVHMGESLR